MSVREREWLTPKGEPRRAYVVDYRDGDGNRRHKTFKQKKAAQNFEARARTEVNDGTHVAEGASITVAEAAKLWIAAKTRARREASTLAQYQQHVDLHIVPFLGDMKLTALTAGQLADFEEQLHEAGRSLAMIRKVKVSLGSLLASAQRKGKVSRNVVRDMRGTDDAADRRADKRATGKLRAGVDFPLPDEIKAIVAHLTGRWRPLLLTAIFTGLRASELRGLTWSAVDLDGKALRVYQRADRFNAIGKPKSGAGDREVPLPPLVTNTLREWKLACPRRATGKLDASGHPIRELHYVFPNGEGNVENLGNIITRGLLPAQVRAGVVADTGKVDQDGQPILAAKYRGMHTLRHFYSSWLINRRVDGGLELPAKVVQERLGHSTINMTMNVYAHLFPRGDDGAEMAAAEALLLG
jgi:integrase